MTPTAPTTATNPPARMDAERAAVAGRFLRWTDAEQAARAAALRAPADDMLEARRLARSPQRDYVLHDMAP